MEDCLLFLLFAELPRECKSLHLNPQDSTLELSLKWHWLSPCTWEVVRSIPLPHFSHVVVTRKRLGVCLIKRLENDWKRYYIIEKWKGRSLIWWDVLAFFFSVFSMESKYLCDGLEIFLMKNEKKNVDNI